MYSYQEKTFPHNDLDSLDRILSIYKDKYRSKLVVVDGVYSQDGDTTSLKDILKICRHHGAYLIVDDAHGIGVVGKTGRGVLERDQILKDVDFITGTFSKSFGNLGGFVICKPETAKFLKFQSKQHIFSATSGASILGILKAIKLIDEEPIWLQTLKANVEYFNNGLKNIVKDISNREYAIIPIKVGNVEQTLSFSKELMKNVIYTNPILYPTVAQNDSRIRMSLSTLHTIEQLNYTLEIISKISKDM